MDIPQRSPGRPVEPEPPRLAGFTVERLLGQGGSARVWLVRPDDGGTPLALKCLHGGWPAEADEIDRELLILERYAHPHLVRLYGARWLDGDPEHPYGLLMDYAAGGSLNRLIAARGALSVGEAVTVLVPLAQLLEYLHSEGVAHGDISGGNVLFTATGKPLLADLGVGRLAADAGASAGDTSRAGTPGFAAPETQPAGAGASAGTPGFAAPETLRPGAGAVTSLSPAAAAAAADVYSLAALGWFALTGDPPPETALRAPLNLQCPAVPRAVALALDAALAADPSSRPLAGQLAAALYRGARSEPLDLAPAVHPSVLAELLTRPAASSSRTGLFRRLRRPPRAAARAGRHRHGVRPLAARAAGVPSRAAGGAGAVRPPAAGADGVILSRAVSWGRRARIRTRWFVVVPAAVVLSALVLGATMLLTGPGRPAATVPGGGAPVAGDPRSAAGPAEDGPRKDGAAAAGSVPDVLDGAALPGDVRAWLESPDPAEALAGLAWLRSYALASGRLELLAAVNVPDSAAMAADADLAGNLRDSGHTLQGLRIVISAELRLPDSVAAEAGLVQPGGTGAAAPAPTTAVVEATAVVQGYTEQDAAGTTLAVHSAGSGQRLRFFLSDVNGRWRIAAIAAPP
ncbi:MAG: serine/threonine protein kinase [Actinomycetales bacterium]